MKLIRNKNCEICSGVFYQKGKQGVSQWNKKRFCSCECRNMWLKSLPITQKGRLVSEETRRKMSIAKTGKPSPHKGKLRPSFIGNKHASYKHTDEQNQKTSEAMKGNKKLIKSLTGRKLSEQHIKNSLRRRDKSSLEIKFESICLQNGLPFMFSGNGSIFVEGKNPDFIHSNGKKIAVEVYYRRHKEQFRNGADEWAKNREEIFNRNGWEIIFFNETDVNHVEVKRRLEAYR